MKGFIERNKQNIALKQTVAVTFLFHGASKCGTVQKERRKFKQIGPCELLVKSQSRGAGTVKVLCARCAVWRCERAQRRRQQCGGLGGRSE